MCSSKSWMMWSMGVCPPISSGLDLWSTSNATTLATSSAMCCSIRLRMRRVATSIARKSTMKPSATFAMKSPTTTAVEKLWKTPTASSPPCGLSTSMWVDVMAVLPWLARLARLTNSITWPARCMTTSTRAWVPPSSYGRMESLVGNLSLADAGSRMDKLYEELEQDHPELTFYKELRAMSQVTGPAASR